MCVLFTVINILHLIYSIRYLKLQDEWYKIPGKR